MQSTKTSLLPPKAFVSLGGSPVCVQRLTTGQTLQLLPNLIALIDSASDSGAGVSIGELVSRHMDDVVQIGAVSTGIPPLQIARLKPKQFSELVESMLLVNRDFLWRAVFVEPMDSGSGQGPDESGPMTVEKAAAFIDRLVYDLRAARACSRSEAMENTLADNLALLDAVSRRAARDKLASLDALQGAISAAFSAEAEKAVSKQIERLSNAAGYGRTASYTGDTTIEL